MNILNDFISDVPAGAVYGIILLAVLAESVLLVGAFIPTLALMLTAGALARTGHLNLAPVIVSAVAAVIAGDYLAHRTGGLLGDRLRTARLGRRIPAAAWKKTEILMIRHGGRAIFLARFLPVVRSIAPHLAGATRLPYRRIAPYSATAALVWATAEATAGYTAATSLEQALNLMGPLSALVALTAVGAVLILSRRRRPHSSHNQSPGTPEDGAERATDTAPVTPEKAEDDHGNLWTTAGVTKAQP
ncbi:DedA family protein [Streptomyces xiamenensis]|uniref:DedA family protein n=1 Tax=Streptomyces xiamenensis TaxID=408015 RepID=UPI00341557F8